jgi:hypothetical protein
MDRADDTLKNVVIEQHNAVRTRTTQKHRNLRELSELILNHLIASVSLDEEISVENGANSTLNPPSLAFIDSPRKQQ